MPKYIVVKDKENDTTYSIYVFNATTHHYLWHATVANDKAAEMIAELLNTDSKQKGWT